MPENERLNRSIDQIELGFVEREATPEFLMKLSIQLHLSALSSSGSLRNEQVVVSGIHATRRPAQGDVRRGL